MKHADLRMGRNLAALSLLLLAVAAVGLLIVLITDGRLDNPLLVAGLTAAALAGLGAWVNEHTSMRRRGALDEKRRGDMAARAKEHEIAAGKADGELSTLRRQIEDERFKLTSERQLRVRTERARRAEREWARELRAQVSTMYKSRGPSADLRELVLEVAIQLSGAERGLLLSQHDGDGDGKLDLVSHRGFERDPGASSLAQRFADRVIERDEIIREDTPGDGHAPADDEIDNLVAIPVYMRNDFEGVIVCANRLGGFEELDDDVLLALGDHAGAVLENHQLHGQLRSSYLAIVRMLADAIEAKDPFVRACSDEVSACVEAVARRLELDGSTCEKLVFASILRDVGKLGISDGVLLKAGPLNADEREIVELHPLIGSRIVERVPGLTGIAAAIRHHHERWDGRGYPDGLRGEAIPIEARVIAVADTYSALTSTRPYRRPISPELACEEVERCAGAQFDPEIARLFVREMRKLGPEEANNGTLAESLDVPAVQTRRRRGEPLLGHGSISSTDHVTLLFSHRYLQEAADTEARRAQRRQRPFAVVMAELTALSQINRVEGYAAGDHALRELGQAIERALNGMTATAGRFSGRRLGVV
ncbi:MAG: HD domain-containing protein, partial [Thermoleophilaceae bacterium]|nr:HD domain-containing protein [Thermoleophilaceae bacterium]